MPQKQIKQIKNKSEVITINKTTLNIDNFDKMTLEEQNEFIALISEGLKESIDKLFNNKNYIYILN